MASPRKVQEPSRDLAGISAARKVTLASVTVLVLASLLFKSSILDLLEEARVGVPQLWLSRKLPFFVPFGFCAAAGALVGVWLTPPDERRNISREAGLSGLPTAYKWCAGSGVLLGVIAGGAVSAWFDATLAGLGYSR